MRELRVTAGDPDTRPDTETLAEWYGEAETVLATLRDRDKAAAAKKQKRRGKLQRVMGQHWLHALDNVLMTLTGAGISRFTLAADAPLCQLSIDG